MEKFDANKVIKEHIHDTDLCTYFVGFDLTDRGNNEYRIDSLIDLLVRVIPEYAFGCKEDLNSTNVMRYINEAAKAIYSIDDFQKVRDIYKRGEQIEDSISDKYLRRGEFGELILHLLLRDYHNTIPLISKIYFKDSLGSNVHGFDAVHINPDEKTLWLGESKIYTDGQAGVKALIQDIKEHIVSNYLDSEFAIIKRKLTNITNIPNIDYWQDLLNKSTTLREKFQQITIPLLCVYESDNFTKYNDEIKEFYEAYEKEVKKLHQYFKENNDHPLKNHLNIILLLFPVKSKKDIVGRLHRNLSVIQELGAL